MDKTIRVHRPLSAHEIVLGKGVQLKLQNATPPIIKFLREKYLEDNSCITGDIKFLFEFDGEGLRPYNKFYRQ